MMGMLKQFLFDGNFAIYVLTYVLAPILLLYRSRPASNGPDAEFLPRGVTDQIRGICILTVVLHHLVARHMAAPGLMMPFNYIGYLAVGVFFFLSSYGMTTALARNEAYLDGFIAKRLAKVYAPFVLLNGLSLAIATIGGGSYPVSRSALFVLSGIGIDIDNTQWFILTIVLFYFLYWLSFRFFRRGAAALCITLGVAVYILVCKQTGLERWWYDATLCFPLGVYIALYRKDIVDLLRRMFVPIAVGSIALFCFTFYFGHPYKYSPIAGAAYLSTMLATVLVILAVSKVTLRSAAFGFIGMLSLEVYMLHMKVLNVVHAYSARYYAGVLLFVAFAALLAAAYLFNRLTGFLTARVLPAEGR